MLRRMLFVSALILLPFTSVLADSAAPPPEGVVALRMSDAGLAAVTWLPPTTGPADYYRVYGYTGSSSSLLAETSGYAAFVPVSYNTYGVTAVRDGVESTPAQTCAQLELDQWLPVHTDC